MSVKQELGGSRIAGSTAAAAARWLSCGEIVVGATGFEPATPCAQGRCATRLRYAPTLTGPLILGHFPTAVRLIVALSTLTVAKLYQNSDLLTRLYQNQSLSLIGCAV